MVDGIFVQKGTLAASFAAAVTPKKLSPTSSAVSGAKGRLSSGERLASGKARAFSGGAEISRPSHIAGTRPSGTSGPDASADRLATESPDRLVDGCGGAGSGSADHAVGEEGRRAGQSPQAAETAVAEGWSSEIGGGPVASRTPLNGGGGSDSGGGGGGGIDGAPTASLSLPTKEQPVAVRNGLDDAAVSLPAPLARLSGNEGEHAPATDTDKDNNDDSEVRDEPALPLSKDNESGDGNGGPGGAGGGSSDVSGSSGVSGSSVGGGGAAAVGDHPFPFELPEMGAAGEGGRSTKDDPEFMKTFFRNSRLHFIGVG